VFGAATRKANEKFCDVAIGFVDQGPPQNRPGEAPHKEKSQRSETSLAQAWRTPAPST
jgi:hypothetical protein